MNATITTLPGTLSSMGRDEYDRNEPWAMRSTALKDLVVPDQGPRAYYLKHIAPIADDEPAGNHFALGILFHEWVLEGKKNWAVATMRKDERTTQYKDFLAENAGKAIITSKDEQLLCGMREGLLRCKEARRLVELSRHEEQVLLWHEEVTFTDIAGDQHAMLVPCKAAIDLWPFSVSTRFCIKTDAAVQGWTNTVFRLGYHMSAAWYERGVHSIPEFADTPFSFSHIVVQKKPPYWCYVRPLGDDALRIGNKDCELALQRFCWGQRAMELGHDPLDAWPDLVERNQGNPVTAPMWVQERYGEQHSTAMNSYEPCWEDPEYA